MNPVYDFSALDHATMLSDHVRLELYRRAIQNQVKEGQVVAEIGTGSGILSAYAASRTKAPVFAIEYYEASARMASEMFKAANLSQVKVMKGESYGITLSPMPEVLVTETIGALGPEENIVELCYDFKKRHPTIHTIIPARLKVYAEPISSRTVKDAENFFYDSYLKASFEGFNYQAVLPGLKRIWSSHIRHDPLSDAEIMGDRTLLADYVLGETQVSAFARDVNLLGLEGVDAVHLYFEAELDGEVLLTTHRMDPITHWGNAYVVKPEGFSVLTVSYGPHSKDLQVEWKN